MPTRKDGAENTEKIIIRWSKNLKDRCELARLAGAHTSDAESTFVRYLIELGIAKYERTILPLEQSQDEPVGSDAPATDRGKNDKKTGNILMTGKASKFFANTKTVYKDQEN
jgi:hypothetical protein